MNKVLEKPAKRQKLEDPNYSYLFSHNWFLTELSRFLDLTECGMLCRLSKDIKFAWELVRNRTIFKRKNCFIRQIERNQYELALVSIKTGNALKNVFDGDKDRFLCEKFLFYQLMPNQMVATELIETFAADSRFIIPFLNNITFAFVTSNAHLLQLLLQRPDMDPSVISRIPDDVKDSEILKVLIDYPKCPPTFRVHANLELHAILLAHPIFDKMNLFSEVLELAIISDDERNMLALFNRGQINHNILFTCHAEIMSERLAFSILEQNALSYSLLIDWICKRGAIHLFRATINHPKFKMDRQSETVITIVMNGASWNVCDFLDILNERGCYDFAFDNNHLIRFWLQPRFQFFQPLLRAKIFRKILSLPGVDPSVEESEILQRYARTKQLTPEMIAILIEDQRVNFATNNNWLIRNIPHVFNQEEQLAVLEMLLQVGADPCADGNKLISTIQEHFFLNSSTVYLSLALRLVEDGRANLDFTSLARFLFPKFGFLSETNRVELLKKIQRHPTYDHSQNRLQFWDNVRRYVLDPQDLNEILSSKAIRTMEDFDILTLTIHTMKDEMATQITRFLLSQSLFIPTKELLQSLLSAHLISSIIILLKGKDREKKRSEKKKKKKKTILITFLIVWLGLIDERIGNSENLKLAFTEFKSEHEKCQQLFENFLVPKLACVSPNQLFFIGTILWCFQSKSERFSAWNLILTTNHHFSTIDFLKFLQSSEISLFSPTDQEDSFDFVLLNQALFELNEHIGKSLWENAFSHKLAPGPFKLLLQSQSVFNANSETLQKLVNTHLIRFDFRSVTEIVELLLELENFEPKSEKLWILVFDNEKFNANLMNVLMKHRKVDKNVGFSVLMEALTKLKDQKSKLIVFKELLSFSMIEEQINTKIMNFVFGYLTNVELMTIFLQSKGVDVNANDKSLVKTLWKNIQNTKPIGVFLIDAVRFKQYISVFKLLLKYHNEVDVSLDDQAILEFACEESNDSELIGYLLNNKSIDPTRNKNERLLSAAKNQKWQTCRLLLVNEKIRNSLEPNQIQFLRETISKYSSNNEFVNDLLNILP